MRDNEPRSVTRSLYAFRFHRPANLTSLSIIIFQMSIFNLQSSIDKARDRFERPQSTSPRRPRADRGRTRIDSRILRWLATEFSCHDRPRMEETLRRLSRFCAAEQLKTPSRATVYNLLEILPVPTYRFEQLPGPVQEALYNMEPSGEIPGHQIAFYCFNYGTVPAMSFAAGLPWLALFQALRMRGYRAKSRGLIEAVAAVRGI